MGESHFLSSQRRPSPWLGPVALGHPGEAAASRSDTGTVPALRATVEGQWRPPGPATSFPSWGHSPELSPGRVTLPSSGGDAVHATRWPLCHFRSGLPFGH